MRPTQIVSRLRRCRHRHLQLIAALLAAIAVVLPARPAAAATVPQLAAKVATASPGQARYSRLLALLRATGVPVVSVSGRVISGHRPDGHTPYLYDPEAWAQASSSRFAQPQDTVALGQGLTALVGRRVVIDQARVIRVLRAIGASHRDRL